MNYKKITKKKLPLLTEDLHMRISSEFSKTLTDIAFSYNLKPSQFSRYILQKHINEYVQQVNV